ncbi:MULTISPECIES: S4 domain-containing protein YaaA [Enterococcus]|uniref:S4 domain-containing protein YaaA n=1 Tax=Candidatus Enterococcus ferrettii TaxID=2815324 RepID=A0ABV0ENI0_9ENTE|nr:S4 domain-containing protein YaaA [Enterococcus sp. 665A]
MKQQIVLKTEYMTLGQLLKEINLISSGGQAKWYLAEQTVFVDGEPENRRGRKLYPGMMVEIPEMGTFFMAKNGNTEDEIE